MADPAAPAEVDLTVYQGQDWTALVELFTDAAQTQFFDLTGYEIDMHVREGVADSEAAVKIALTTRVGATGAGRIVVVGRDSSGTADPDSEAVPTDGCFKLVLDDAVTKAVAPTKKPKRGSAATAEFLYDIELTSAAGVVTRVMRGVLTLDLEVTRL